MEAPHASQRSILKSAGNVATRRVGDLSRWKSIELAISVLNRSLQASVSRQLYCL
jgi:hypothetical protein